MAPWIACLSPHMTGEFLEQHTIKTALKGIKAMHHLHYSSSRESFLTEPLIHYGLEESSGDVQLLKDLKRPSVVQLKDRDGDISTVTIANEAFRDETTSLPRTIFVQSFYVTLMPHGHHCTMNYQKDRATWITFGKAVVSPITR